MAGDEKGYGRTGEKWEPAEDDWVKKGFLYVTRKELVGELSCFWAKFGTDLVTYIESTLQGHHSFNSLTIVSPVLAHTNER